MKTQYQLLLSIIIALGGAYNATAETGTPIQGDSLDTLTVEGYGLGDKVTNEQLKESGFGFRRSQRYGYYPKRVCEKYTNEYIPSSLRDHYSKEIKKIQSDTANKFDELTGHLESSDGIYLKSTGGFNIALAMNEGTNVITGIEARKSYPMGPEKIVSAINKKFNMDIESVRMPPVIEEIAKRRHPNGLYVAIPMDDSPLPDSELYFTNRYLTGNYRVLEGGYFYSDIYEGYLDSPDVYVIPSFTGVFIESRSGTSTNLVIQQHLKVDKFIQNLDTAAKYCKSELLKIMDKHEDKEAIL